MTDLQRIEKTLRTIRRFVAATSYRAIPKRGLQLVDRYNDERARLIERGGYSNPEWVAYCERHGMAPSHDGYDLFC